MSAEATAAPAPEHTAAQLDVVATEPTHAKCSSPKPAMGLHSPPDSDKLKLDGSDSELSDLEDPEPDPALDHLEQPSQPVETVHDAASDDNPKAEPDAAPEPVEDIGEVLPDHWSGTVPVFKPDMRQFKDFKQFVSSIEEALRKKINKKNKKIAKTGATARIDPPALTDIANCVL